MLAKVNCRFYQWYKLLETLTKGQSVCNKILMSCLWLGKNITMPISKSFNCCCEETYCENNLSGFFSPSIHSRHFKGYQEIMRAPLSYLFSDRTTPFSPPPPPPMSNRNVTYKGSSTDTP